MHLEAVIFPSIQSVSALMARALVMGIKCRRLPVAFGGVRYCLVKGANAGSGLETKPRPQVSNFHVKRQKECLAYSETKRER